MLKSFLLFAAVVLLVLASASAPARPPQEGNQSAAPGKKPTADAMAKAKKVYELDCALCHGATGDGKTDLAKDMQLSLMDWSDPKTLAGQSDQALIDVIRKGKGKMPPEDAARASNDEVRNLVIVIRKFAKDQPAAATPAPAPAAAPEQTPAPASTPAQSPSSR
ncbi:MAG TPA: cytochrome c [Terracidiphilus sp.]|jgi:cytochrome c5|nr:cytochrome c [Terracidiphilus sp.]